MLRAIEPFAEKDFPIKQNAIALSWYIFYSAIAVHYLQIRARNRRRIIKISIIGIIGNVLGFV